MLLLLLTIALFTLSFWLQRRPYLATSQKTFDERKTYAMLGLFPAIIALFIAQDLFQQAYPQLSTWWVLLGFGVVSFAIHALYIWPARRAMDSSIDTSLLG